MRVKGNVSPVTLSMESYLPLVGYVEVRIRENIKEVTDIDPQTETSVTMFEYDEYTFLLKDREGLREDIESNLNDWLMTGRMLEVNENASVVQDMRTELKNAVSTGDLENAYREGVNSV